MADGFLGRWSQRKQAVRDGRPTAEPVPQEVPSAPAPGSANLPDRPEVKPLAVVDRPTQTDARGQPAPALTLADVKALKPDDSFARFVTPDVAPDVRNAAMKKLFTDPHYNVMDGLDIYIDDYSLPSPLPAAMLRQMASAKFLNLFEEDPSGVRVAQPDSIGEDAHGAAAPSVAQSAPTLPAEPVPALAPNDLIEKNSHDDPDLRLQPDHAAGCAALEREPERTFGPAQQPVPPRSG